MSDYTPTYILTWNPNKFDWKDYEETVDLCKQKVVCMFNWSCRSKQPKINDRVILLMQGMDNKNGIVGYGHVTEPPYELPFSDWGGRFLTAKFDRMWNYKTDKYVRTDVLKSMFPEQNFSPQFSGIRIKSSVLPDLWKLIERS